MTDFDRYEVMKAKKMRNGIIKPEVRKLQKAALLKASPKKGAAAKIPEKKKKKKRWPLQARRLPSRSFLPGKLQVQKAVPPKAQKDQKTPAQKAPAPEASGKKF